MIAGFPQKTTNNELSVFSRRRSLDRTQGKREAADGSSDWTNVVEHQKGSIRLEAEITNK
jgi:hypothetical protein